MTDIMKLADDYAAKNRAVANVIEQGTSGELIEADGDKKRARAALKSAIEALQEENALLEGTLESRGRNIAALQAENEQFRLLAKANSEALGAALVERDALQAKLDELRRQEPVEYQSFTKPGFISCSPASWEPCTHEQYQDHFIEGTPVRKLYTSPKALAPRFTECRIELVGAIHTLASHYENRLRRLDPEDRKLAEGDIAHAMATAAKWNWNGNGIGGTP